MKEKYRYFQQFPDESPELSVLIKSIGFEKKIVSFLFSIFYLCMFLTLTNLKFSFFNVTSVKRH